MKFFDDNFDDNFWWQVLMTIFDDNFFMKICDAIFDDNFWWPFFTIQTIAFAILTIEKTILETCEIWDTDYNSDNWEPEFMTIFEKESVSKRGTFLILV